MSLLGDGQSDAQRVGPRHLLRGGCLGGEARKEDKPGPQNLFVQVFKKFSFLSKSRDFTLEISTLALL